MLLFSADLDVTAAAVTTAGGQVVQGPYAFHLLGASRQHVVDLCDRGELGCILVGAHRRIPSTEIERLTGSELTREKAKSLWLHWAAR